MATDILPSEIPMFSGGSKVSTSYIFNPQTMRITVSDLDFKRVLYVINSTHSVVMYNPYDKDKLGDSTLTGVVMNFPVAAAGYMLATDDLVVVYEGDQAPTVTQGGVRKVNTTNDAAEGSLTQVLKQLEILNLHMSILTDNTITEEDVG